MKCPKCDGSMRRVTVRDIEVDRCIACDGVWFDLREQDRLKAIDDSEDKVDPPRGGRHVTGSAKQATTCPHCRSTLIQVAVPGQTHIKYEQCSTCGGSFFDAGEFRDFKELGFVERVLQLIPGLKR